VIPATVTGALLLVACGAEPALDPLAPWPDDPEGLLAACDQQAFPELTTTCRVQAAARLAQTGDATRADAVCALIEPGTWRDECHFRVGEELGRAGETLPALTHCRQAGWFARNCLTHAGWRLPPDPTLTAAEPPERIAAAGAELASGLDVVLAGAPDGLEGEGRDIVMARFGYNAYVGTGAAHPDPARLPDPLGVVLRTGLGIEAARLLPEPDLATLEAVFTGERPAPIGTPLPVPQRMGRYTPPVPSPHEDGAPRVPLYGGGMRLVGETPAEDAAVAALEGLYWLPQTPAEVFLPHVDDPRARVRWTAVKLLRTSEPRTLDMEETLTALAAEHPDENVRWHAAEGLSSRSWERRQPPRPPAHNKPGRPR